jgi:hypothetical protein
VRLTAIGIVAAGALCSGLALAASLDVDLSFDATEAVGFPPDTTGAAGPEHVVTFTNGGATVFRKSDGIPLSHVFLNSFGATPAWRIPSTRMTRASSTTRRASASSR